MPPVDVFAALGRATDSHISRSSKKLLSATRVALFAVHESAMTATRVAAGATTGTFLAPWDAQIDLGQAKHLTGPDL